MYLKWKEQTITDFSDENISRMYDSGYVFGRTGRGGMYQTRSLRIDLHTFELSSENRRILRKTDDLRFSAYGLPFTNYDWSIGKMAKDFYDTKFDTGTFSANKVKELLTDETKSNFNRLFIYTLSLRAESAESQPRLTPPLQGEVEPQGREVAIGYTICYENSDILHYSYPFYEVRRPTSDVRSLGMGMMVRAIEYAKENAKQYVYLGSFSRPTDTYKLQFKGLEWFDGEGWNKDMSVLKMTV